MERISPLVPLSATKIVFEDKRRGKVLWKLTQSKLHFFYQILNIKLCKQSGFANQISHS
jgi:hypothetical protein